MLHTVAIMSEMLLGISVLGIVRELQRYFNARYRFQSGSTRPLRRSGWRKEKKIMHKCIFRGSAEASSCFSQTYIVGDLGDLK